MAKDKGGREAKKPTAAHNKKVKGQTPTATDPALKTIGQGKK